MSKALSGSITSVGEFLVHALELEIESVERYQELADSMEVHHNPDVAALFQKLSDYSALHAEEVKQRTQGMVLPEISPWDFKWSTPEGPETAGMSEANYMMNPAQVLQLALHNEIRGRDFYAEVAADSPDPQVRRIAAEMVEEEDEHVELLKQWIAREGATAAAPPEDLDPPNMPE
jgi:rubrerythrin